MSDTLDALRTALAPKTGMRRVPFPTGDFVLKYEGIPKYNPCMTYVRHGMTKTPFLGVWLNMIQRTTNSKNSGYKNYGGRGIVVCERWQSFLNFKEDMYPTYKPNLLIDRIDNDGPYSPENCRWTSRNEQMKNRRPGSLWDLGRKPNTTNKSGFVGVFWSERKKRWISTIQINGRFKQIGTFHTPEEGAEAYQRIRTALREGRQNV
jgi:hypothetical protein